MSIWRNNTRSLPRVAVFQAHKFLATHPRLAERIRQCPSPRAALQEAGRLRRLQRTDWFDVNVGIMESILEDKFVQHPRLQHMLLETGDREIIEASPVRKIQFVSGGINL